MSSPPTATAKTHDRVSRRAAYVVRSLLAKDQTTGEYRTTDTLAEHMADRHSIPLNGDALVGRQSRLDVVAEEPHARSRRPERDAPDMGRARQRTLSGERVEIVNASDDEADAYTDAVLAGYLDETRHSGDADDDDTRSWLLVRYFGGNC